MYSVTYHCTNCGAQLVEWFACGQPAPEHIDCRRCGCYKTARKQIETTQPIVQGQESRWKWRLSGNV